MSSQLSHRTLQEQERNRLALMCQTPPIAAMELRSVRPVEEESSMFLTPENSPPYTANDGGACYTTSCQYPNGLSQPGINDLPPVHASSPQYMQAPASPIDEHYYPGHSPYSSPYEDSSVSCSPHSTGSCGIEYERHFMPEDLPMTSIASSCAPMVSSGVAITTADGTITTMPLQTSRVIPPQGFYPAISHVGEWPSQPARFTEAGFVPAHSEAIMIPTSVPDGELQITVFDQTPDTIAYYPMTPDSPENKFNCQDYQKPAIFVPTCGPLPTMGIHMPHDVKQHATTKPQKRKRPERPAIQVDDSDIKDIPTSAQLWEFTLRVLKKPKYHYMVNWENKKEGLFRFHDAAAFATLWGKHRNRPNMTYDKVARALRYYYKRDILNQVGGRLTYRFSQRLSKLYMCDD